MVLAQFHFAVILSILDVLPHAEYFQFPGNVMQSSTCMPVFIFYFRKESLSIRIHLLVSSHIVNFSYMPKAQSSGGAQLFQTFKLMLGSYNHRFLCMRLEHMVFVLIFLL